MIVLTSVLPEKNRRRIYAITLSPSLFYKTPEPDHQYALICQWGRMGVGLSRKRAYLFGTRRKALEEAQRLVRLRFRHGYEVTRKGSLHNEMEDLDFLPPETPPPDA